MKIYTILLVALFSIVSHGYEGDTYIAKNSRTNNEYVIRNAESINIQYLIDNANNGDTFVWYAKDENDDVVQDKSIFSILDRYCSSNGGLYSATLDIPNKKRTSSISNGGLHVIYDLYFNGTRSEIIKVVK